MRYHQLLESYPVDNHDGLGNVPNNLNVDYLGLKVMMKPSVFLKLATPLEQEISPEFIELIKNYAPIGAPFLTVQIPYEWTEGDFSEVVKVRGHEGRHRMSAIRSLHSDDPIETHIFPRGEMRARHITDDMISMMQQQMQAEQSPAIVKGPLFTL